MRGIRDADSCHPFESCGKKRYRHHPVFDTFPFFPPWPPCIISMCPGRSNFSKQPTNKSPCNVKHRNTTNNYFSTQAKHRHDTERRHCRGKDEKSLDGVFVDVETASTTFILGIRIVQNNRTTEEATVRFFSVVFNNQRYREHF